MVVLSWIVLALVTAFNVFLTAFPLAVLGLKPQDAVALGAAVTFAFGAFGMPPLGERLSRRLLKLRRPKPEEEKKLKPAYEKVLARAGWESRATELFLIDSEEVNGVAVGSGTIAVTTACLRLPERGTLRHPGARTRAREARRRRPYPGSGVLGQAQLCRLPPALLRHGFLRLPDRIAAAAGPAQRGSSIDTGLRRWRVLGSSGTTGNQSNSLSRPEKR